MGGELRYWVILGFVFAKTAKYQINQNLLSLAFKCYYIYFITISSQRYDAR